MTDSLGRYRELLTRVDSLFAEIRARHPTEMKCGLNCHQCCRPDLTVGPLEAAHLREALARDPARASRLRSVEESLPHESRRCAFLDATGACGIYELRPIVCRSHGAPLQFRAEAGETRLRDVCELNFTTTPIGQLPPGDVMNLDTLNTLLALLTRASGGNPEERSPLKPSALCP